MLLTSFSPLCSSSCSQTFNDEAPSEMLSEASSLEVVIFPAASASAWFSVKEFWVSNQSVFVLEQKQRHFCLKLKDSVTENHAEAEAAEKITTSSDDASDNTSERASSLKKFVNKKRSKVVRKKSAACCGFMWMLILLFPTNLFPHLGQVGQKSEGLSLFSTILILERCPWIYCYLAKDWSVPVDH